MRLHSPPFLLPALLLPLLAAAPPLIVVEDLGGSSALPYYRQLNLPLSPADTKSPPRVPVHAAADRAHAPYTEADLLPIRSTRLTTGRVARRAIHIPGLTPIFLLGDDPQSRAWLRARAETLRALGAVGWVVNVETHDALQSLRHLVPGITLVPASGDDLAQRLAIDHYPVLITATSIEP